MCSGTEGATNEVEPLEEVTLVMPVEGKWRKKLCFVLYALEYIL